MLKTLLECHENQDINMSTAPSPPKKQKKKQEKTTRRDKNEPGSSYVGFSINFE